MRSGNNLFLLLTRLSAPLGVSGLTSWPSCPGAEIVHLLIFVPSVMTPSRMVCRLTGILRAQPTAWDQFRGVTCLNELAEDKRSAGDKSERSPLCLPFDKENTKVAFPFEKQEDFFFAS